MLTLNTQTPLVNPRNGETLKDENNQDLLIQLVLGNILFGPSANPTRAYQLATKIVQNDSVELKAEDVVFIKGEVEKTATRREAPMSSLVIGQIMSILDDNS